MVNTCCALNCKNGYNNQVELGTTFHKFPLSKKDILTKWIKNLHRENFVPTKYSRICSKHFKESDFSNESKDTNIRRKRKRNSIELHRR